MSYRHPNEIISNKELLEECMHDAVKCGLNEVMPEVMAEFEEVIDEKMEAMKTELMTNSNSLPAAQTPSYQSGIYMGLAIGGCLFVGLVIGLIIGVLL